MQCVAVCWKKSTYQKRELIQGGKDAHHALSCGSLSANEPLIIGLFYRVEKSTHAVTREVRATACFLSPSFHPDLIETCGRERECVCVWAWESVCVEEMQCVLQCVLPCVLQCVLQSALCCSVCCSVCCNVCGGDAVHVGDVVEKSTRALTREA